MSKTTMNLRIDSSLKKKAEKVVNDLGIPMSVAITLFLKALVREGGLPFSVKVAKEQKPILEIESKIAGETREKSAIEYPDSNSLRNAINKL